MEKKTCLTLPLMMLGIVLLGATSIFATIGPPPNQCPGDCSPCLGPSDPFCGQNGDGSTSHFCVLCESPTGNCRDARTGEIGKDSSCRVVTYGMTVISCTYSGNSCQGTVTH